MITKSETQTFNLGKKIAKTLKGGEVLALTGQLGAGKTVLIKGLAAGLGIKKIITSPTFVLMKIYKIGIRNQELGIRNLVHIDCYRIRNADEIIAIGAGEYFGRPNTVTAIEWADKIKPIIPAGQTKKIEIKLKGKNNREIIIK